MNELIIYLDFRISRENILKLLQAIQRVNKHNFVHVALTDSFSLRITCDSDDLTLICFAFDMLEAILNFDEKMEVVFEQK
jgi:hypothetical protein